MHSKTQFSKKYFKRKFYLYFYLNFILCTYYQRPTTFFFFFSLYLLFYQKKNLSSFTKIDPHNMVPFCSLDFRIYSVAHCGGISHCLQLSDTAKQQASLFLLETFLEPAGTFQVSLEGRQFLSHKKGPGFRGFPQQPTLSYPGRGRVFWHQARNPYSKH